MRVNEVLETMSNEAIAVVITIGEDGYYICAYKKDLINDKCFIDKKVGDRTVTHLGVTRTPRGFGIVIQCIINNDGNKDYLEDYCNTLEKALDNACEYIHDCGSNGCPNNYDGEEMKECKMCNYECMSLDYQLHSSKQQNNEYLKKSIKCWRKYFLRGDTENDEN